jgi:nucleoside-diphosphate-sugar epimerase
MAKTIALTGTTGFIGPHVIRRLLADGHRLSCLVRPGRSYEALPGVRYCEGSLEDAKSLKALLDGADTLVHLAGLTRAKSEEQFMAVNCLAVRTLIEAGLAASPRFSHIVAMSSLAAVGPARDERGVCEDEPPTPLTPYGRSKAALEELLKRYEPRVAWTAIRAPGVYGPGDRDFYEYFKLIKRGYRVVLGKRNVLSLVYVENLADAVALAVERPEARNEAFFIADDGAYDWDDIGAMIERAFGVQARRVTVPFWAVRVASLLSRAIAPLSKKPILLTKDKLLEMCQEYWVASTAKAGALLGYRPGISTSDGFRRTATWYEERGWL